jgi:hypothetical protein
MIRERNHSLNPSHKVSVEKYLSRSGHREYKKEMYDASCQVMQRRWEKCHNEIERRQVLTGHFVDWAHWYIARRQASDLMGSRPRPKKEHSRFFETFGFDPLEIDSEKLRFDGAIIIGDNAEFDGFKPQSNFDSVAYQYGPSTIYNVAPGEHVVVRSLGEQDIVGSLGFSSCTAVVARRGQETIFSHVRNSTNVDGVVKGIKNKFEGIQEIAIVRPTYFPKKGK